VNSEHSLLISPISFKIDQWDGIEPLRSYGKGAKEEAVEQVKAYCEKLAKEAKSLKIMRFHFAAPPPSFACRSAELRTLCAMITARRPHTPSGQSPMMRSATSSAISPSACPSSRRISALC
jgi:hypothetical protein